MKLCYHRVMDVKSISPPRPSRWRILLGLLRELGPAQLVSYALYRLGLRSGHFRRATGATSRWTATRSAPLSIRRLTLPPRAELLDILGVEGKVQLLAEADEVVAGQVRLFGGNPILLVFDHPQPLLHWTDYELGAAKEPVEDIKLVWEPARLGWATLLARAYFVSGNERYAEVFWTQLENFLAVAPPYLGLNWVSAQEAAIRLLALVFCWQTLAVSHHSTPERAAVLAEAVEQHARRIPPTLVYARAQNNNHLLSEAAGLFTAGLVLPDHPLAPRWRKMGWKWFQHGLRAQITPDGTYTQHSLNYHRLMLQLALWVDALARQDNRPMPSQSQDLLTAATGWLLALLDRTSGRTPNLGPNDGAYILPLTTLPYGDFRPVAQAAAIAFLGGPFLEAGPWDEMPFWFGYGGTPMKGAQIVPGHSKQLTRPDASPHVLHAAPRDSWAYLRAARFNGRPGHADQLHVDLWWRGVNIALDAGTYLYNAAPPWDNALAGSDVHNTITVDGLDQMQRAGRFLFLEWAQAHMLQVDDTVRIGQQLMAEHDGFRRLGVIHRRTLTAMSWGWQVDDALLPEPDFGSIESQHTACLHWLLPDWPWELKEVEDTALLRMTSPHGLIELRLSTAQPEGGLITGGEMQIVRAGELLFGQGGVKPVWGWYSPTYNVKIPALSVRLTRGGRPPLHFKSEWRFG